MQFEALTVRIADIINLKASHWQSNNAIQINWLPRKNKTNIISLLSVWKHF